MVSSSHVGDAIRVRWDDVDAVVRSVAATRVRAVDDSLETMMIQIGHHLAIRQATRDYADHAHSAGATDWLPQTGLRPT